MVSHLLEVVNLPAFDIDGEHYERNSLVSLDVLSREWGGNVVQQYLQSGRLRVAHPEARSYVDGEMYGEHARLLVSDGVVPFGPGVGYRYAEELQPTEAPQGLEEPPAPTTSEPAGEPAPFDPYSASPAVIRQYVTDHPGEATAVLSVELTGKNRKGVVTWLQELIGATEPSEGPTGEPDEDDPDGGSLSDDGDGDFVVAKD